MKSAPHMKVAPETWCPFRLCSASTWSGGGPLWQKRHVLTIQPNCLRLASACPRHLCPHPPSRDGAWLVADGIPVFLARWHSYQFRQDLKGRAPSKRLLRRAPNKHLNGGFCLRSVGIPHPRAVGTGASMNSPHMGS